MNSNDLKRNLVFSSDPLDGYGGNRCADIYKSLLRDIKNFHRDQFEEFKRVNDLNSNLRILKEAFFPLHIKLFVDEYFDKDIIRIMNLYANQ